MSDNEIKLTVEDIKRDMRILKVLVAVQGLSFLLSFYAALELYRYFN